MWLKVAEASFLYLCFIVAISVIGCLSFISNADEVLSAIIAGVFGFPLWGIIELMGVESVHQGKPIYELMKLNSWLFYVIVLINMVTLIRKD
jgi:hypothetical protein